MKASKLRVTGLCERTSPVYDDFPAQRAWGAENVSTWWRHQDFYDLISVLIKIGFFYVIAFYVW